MSEKRLVWKKSCEEDLKTVTEISISAFHSDAYLKSNHPEFPGKEELLAGGPPGYDDETWHKDMSNKGFLRTLWFNEEIIGASIVYFVGNGVIEIGRIFISPAYQKKGLGLEAINMLEHELNAKSLRLETPAWNVRTRAFYLKAGYRLVKETKEDCFFAKPLSHNRQTG